MCRWILLWVSLMSLVVAIPEEHQYCAVRYRRLCQGKGRHIACQFPDSGPGPSCEHYTQIKFTNDLKHFITHYLNRRRQRIAAGNERVRGGIHLPKPQVMMLVEWDRELALLAQRLADQCHFVHDDCRATVRYPYAGQTVGEVRWRRSSESDELSAQRAIRRVLDAWWGERRRVQPKQLTAPFRLTAKGTVWGHFSQLAVWNLQAVGCGAVRHGAHHPRLLLVCDFSHTNMLGQRTLVSGSMAPCPIHTARRPRTAYPLLCAPVRHPVPAEPDEMDGMEDNYEDDDEEDSDLITVDVGDVPTPSLWLKRTEKRLQRTGQRTKVNIKSSPIREFPDATRKLDTIIYRGPFAVSPTTVKESIIQKIDRELEHKTRNKVKDNVKYKETHNTFDGNQFEKHNNFDGKKFERHNTFDGKKFERHNTFDSNQFERHNTFDGNEFERHNTFDGNQFEKHNTFDGNQFESVVRTNWRTKKKPNFGQWRQHHENPENLEEVIPLTVPRREVTETFEPTVVEVYRPTIREDITEHVERTAPEVYRPTIREREDTIEQVQRHIPELYRPTVRDDITEHETNFRQRWRQTRVRPQRPGANALLYTPTGKYSRKEVIASLNLDKEDIDQLFRDTGFNFDWRKQTT